MGECCTACQVHFPIARMHAHAARMHENTKAATVACRRLYSDNPIAQLLSRSIIPTKFSWFAYAKTKNNPAVMILTLLLQLFRMLILFYAYTLSPDLSLRFSLSLSFSLSAPLPCPSTLS